MSRRTLLKTLPCLLAGLAPAPAVAQVCIGVPGTPGQGMNGPDIRRFAERGVKLVQSERHQTGVNAVRMRNERVRWFRRLSLVHWRFTCNVISKIQDNPAMFADALTRGALYYDLSDDVPRMRIWVPLARAQLDHLIASDQPVPLYLGQSLDNLVVLMEQRTAGVSKRSTASYLTVRG